MKSANSFLSFFRISSKESEKGFTLVELVVSVAIIMILAQMGTFYFLDAKRKSADAAALSDGRNMMNAIINSFLSLEDIDFSHGGDFVNQVGVKDNGGNARAAIYQLPENVRARFDPTSTSPGTPGSGYVSVSVYHTEGSADPMTASGKREYLYIIDEDTGQVDIASY